MPTQDHSTTYVLNDVAMIANEEICATVGHVDLHPDQAWSRSA
jgi:hypothetical protein